MSKLSGVLLVGLFGLFATPAHAALCIEPADCVSECGKVAACVLGNCACAYAPCETTDDCPACPSGLGSVQCSFNACSCSRGQSCGVDSDCLDTIFCNGTERCEPSDPAADRFGCILGAPADCGSGRTCDGALDRCISGGESCGPGERDMDLDMHDRVGCGGDDCDDDDPNRYPGNPEVCDLLGHDEDCDPRTIGNLDSDRDGHVASHCCNEDATGNMLCGDDCDDSRSDVHPSQPDPCNGTDDNCDGFIDDLNAYAQFMVDADGDGFGDPGAGLIHSCPGIAGTTHLGGDCDDANPAIVPGAMICDPANDTRVLICSAGGYVPLACPDGKSSCVTQANGTGICSPRKQRG